MKESNRWTVDEIIERLEAAAETMKLLPAVKVTGYVSAWPEMIYSQMETFQMEVKNKKSVPTPEAITRMEEACLWLRLVPCIDDRRLLWMRAERIRWKIICKKFGIKRTAANERWRNALEILSRKVIKGH